MSFGCFDDAPVLAVRPQQSTNARHLSTQLEHLAVRGRRDQVLGSGVAEVVDERPRVAIQRVAPEQLDSHGASREQAADVGQVVGSERQAPQPEIHARDARVLLRALLEKCRVRHGRNGVRHLQQRGDPARRRGARGVREVLFVRQPWIARVHVRVDEARKNQTALGVDDFVHARRARAQVTDLLDGAIATQDISALRAASRDQGAVGNFQPHAECQRW